MCEAILFRLKLEYVPVAFVCCVKSVINTRTKKDRYDKYLPFFFCQRL